MTFLALYLTCFMRAHSPRPISFVFLIPILMPLVLAAWISSTRIIDNHHNASDVIAGALIGIFFACTLFFWRFPTKLSTPKRVESGHVRKHDVRSGALCDSNTGDQTVVFPEPCV
jgi:diacylglycerol diphosphate phosphatase / phosphatidate phosphatase